MCPLDLQRRPSRRTHDSYPVVQAETSDALRSRAATRFKVEYDMEWAPVEEARVEEEEEETAPSVHRP